MKNERAYVTVAVEIPGTYETGRGVKYSGTFRDGKSGVRKLRKLEITSLQIDTFKDIPSVETCAHVANIAADHVASMSGMRVVSVVPLTDMENVGDVAWQRTFGC